MPKFVKIEESSLKIIQNDSKIGFFTFEFYVQHLEYFQILEQIPIHNSLIQKQIDKSFDELMKFDESMN